MKRLEIRKGLIAETAVTILIVIVIFLPIMATAASISLNVKDSTGTDKFAVMDSGFVGIGSNNPKKPIFVEGTDATNVQIISHCTNPSPPSSGNVTQGGGFLVYFNYPNNGLPMAGDRLGYYLFGAYDTDGDSVRNSAGIAAKAEQNWVSGLNGSTLSYPSYLTLETTGVAGGRMERVRITSDGNVGIGSTSPGTYKLYVAGDLFTSGVWVSSDNKLKKNVKGIDTPLDKITKIEGVQYEFKREEFTTRNLPGGKHYGVIAQQLETVLPEAVKLDSDGMRAVAYEEIIPVLIEAIKAQQKQIEELRQRVR